MKKYSYIYYILLVLSINACVFNHIPIADNQCISVDENSTDNTITLSATDMDNNILTYEIIEQPKHGQLKFINSFTNMLNYTPDRGYIGLDDFTFIVKDANSSSMPAMVSITVKELKINHPPRVFEQNLTVDKNSTDNTITLIGTDIDSDILTYEITEQPKHGQLVFSDSSNNMLNYIPNIGYVGIDNFMFIAKDIDSHSTPAMVSIIIKNKIKLLTIIDTKDRSNCKKYVEKSGEDLNNNGILDENEITLNHPVYEIGTPLSLNQLKEMIRNNENVTKVNTCEITDMSHLFEVSSDSSNCFINQDISKWNTGAVIDMSYMFNSCIIFNQNITEWDVHNVTNMSHMFHGTSKFNQDISKWNISKVTMMDAIFEGLTLDTNIYDAILTKWSYLDVRKGVPFGGGNNKYSSSTKYFRQKLINEFNWIITDGGSINAIHPMADHQIVRLVKNTVKNITLHVNDEHVENLIYSIKTQPNHGTLTGTIPQIVYTPEANYTGEDSFTFIAKDGINDSNIVIVTIDIVDIVANKDSDNDGIPDQIELILGTDINDSDENNNNILDGLETEGKYGDTFFDMQWHIKSLGTVVNDSGVPSVLGNDLRLENVYKKYMGYNHGTPIIVQVVDSKVDMNHEDLKENIDKFTTYNYPQNPYIQQANPHGTMVAGIIASRGFNGLGTRGVVPFSKISSSNWLESNQSVEDLEEVWFSGRGANNIAISNNSWGQGIEFGVDTSIEYEMMLKKSVTELRESKGRIYIFSAGNDRIYGGNSNMGYIHNNRYVITVAALTHTNRYAFYSNSGGNLLISAYGGETAEESPTIGTTTLSGYSFIGKNTWEKDYKQNYTYAMNGTSAAAPIVSGVLALVLEACPRLTWRDVKYLVATTGIKIDNNNSSWVKNSAGLWHSSDYGYGLISAEGIINSCSENNYTLLGMEKIAQFEGTKDIDIVDGEYVEIGGLDINNSMIIEWVEITIDSNHSMAGDLKIELISPSGTVSNIIDPTITYESAIPTWMQGGFRFGAAGFIGENSKGSWRVKIHDTVNNGNIGTMHSIKLKIYGH